MKRIINFLLIFSMLAGFAGMDAKTTKSKSKKKTTTQTKLPVTKGETKQYGDYLTTQFFTVKKGKENKVTVEYPIGGNPQLVKTLRDAIVESMINGDETSAKKPAIAPETPEELLRKMLKGKKDVGYNQIGESLEEDITISYASPSVVTLSDVGYSYTGGAHGLPWSLHTTYLVEDGSKLDSSMLPSIDKMRPYILNGIAKYYDTSVSNLSDYLFENPRDIDYGTVYVNGDGLNVIYQVYEIAPYSDGQINAVIPISDIYNIVSPTVQKFLK